MANIKTKYFGVNLAEMAALIVFGLIVINGIIFLFSIIAGARFLEVFKSTWLISLGYPVLHGIIQSYINRNGVMTITEFDDPVSLTEEIEHSAGRIGYKITKKDNGNLRFNRRSKSGRILNLLFREDFRVTVSDSEVKIRGKRNPLKRIGKRLTYLR